jgi:helix-turn-helix protein
VKVRRTRSPSKFVSLHECPPGCTAPLESLIADPRACTDAELEAELDTESPHGLDAELAAQVSHLTHPPYVGSAWAAAEVLASALAFRAALSGDELRVLTYVLWLRRPPEHGELASFARAGEIPPATMRGYWLSARRKLRQSRAQSKPSALLEAAMFLRKELAKGPQPSAAVEKAAATAGISRRTLERACYHLVVARRVGGRSGHWELRLRPLEPTVAEVARRFRRSKSTIRSWLAAGLIPDAYKRRRLGWRVPSACLASFTARGWYLATGGAPTSSQLRWRPTPLASGSAMK